MNIKGIQKMALTLAIVQTIALSACSIKDNSKDTNTQETFIEEVYTDNLPSNDYNETPNFINTNFTNITENKDKVFIEDTDIYDYEGKIVGKALINYECTAVATNGEYTLVSMKNIDNSSLVVSGLVKNDTLTDKVNQINSYAYINKDSVMYYDKELENKSFNVYEGKMVKVLFIKDNYASISMEGGKSILYMNIDDIDLIDTNELKDSWFYINSYHYLSKDAYLFADQNFNNPVFLFETYEKVFVIKSNGEWSYVLTDTGKDGYMETFLLYKLPNLFIDVDISDQTTKLYKNEDVILKSYNVTGRDATPTDLGYFDVDEMERKTYLRAYNPDGSLEYETYVEYWIPYNAGEGLHDAPWQSPYFGSKDYYHTGGSHGCVNMPLDAARTLYENVSTGTRVLVHK